MVFFPLSCFARNGVVIGYRQRGVVHSSVIVIKHRYYSSPILRHKPYRVAVYMQTSLTMDCPICGNTLGTRVKLSCSLNPYLLQESHIHAFRLSSTGPPVCSVIFQRIEVHSVVDAVDAISVKLKLLLQWPFQSPISTKPAATRSFVRSR